MSLPADASCMLCLFKKNLALARSLGDDETATAFMLDFARSFLELPRHMPSTALGPTTTELLSKYYGLDPDRFREERRLSNEFVVSRLDDIGARVRSAKDPVQAALQFAILGNYLDFSALQGEVSFEALHIVA